MAWKKKINLKGWIWILGGQLTYNEPLPQSTTITGSKSSINEIKVPTDHVHELTLNLIRMLKQLLLHLRHPIWQGSINESMNNEFGRSICFKVRSIDGIFIFSNKQLTIGGIVICIQYESCVDDISWQREDIEWSMNQMIPFSCDV